MVPARVTFPGNGSKPCWIANGRNSSTNWARLVDHRLVSSPSSIPSPHETMPERMSLTAGSVCAFSSSLVGTPTTYVLHVNLRDPSNLLQQEAIGILGVNLIYAAFHQSETSEQLISGIAQDVESRIEIDYVDLRGPAFETWDRRTLLVHLVRAGFAEIVCFPSNWFPVPPTEVIHNNPVVLAPGYFVHVDPTHAEIHTQMLASAIRELQEELGEVKTAPRGFFCLTLTPPDAKDPLPETSHLLRRIDALRSGGGDVLLTRQQELYTLTDFVNRYTREPVRFVVGLSVVIRAFEDRYSKLAGGFLEALSRLLARNVRIYAYPMTSKDLQQVIQNLSATGWEWEETNGWVSPVNYIPRNRCNTCTITSSTATSSSQCNGNKETSTSARCRRSAGSRVRG